MQFVCPYCGPIDWNNKYSYSYSYSLVLANGRYAVLREGRGDFDIRHP
jgi:hypothetical protein